MLILLYILFTFCLFFHSVGINQNNKDRSIVRVRRTTKRMATMADLQTQRKPAYKGAKFDTSGYCLNHPKIQLCRPSLDFDGLTISECKADIDEGEVSSLTYSVIRKICPKCGERNFSNNRIQPMVRKCHISFEFHDS